MLHHKGVLLFHSLQPEHWISTFYYFRDYCRLGCGQRGAYLDLSSCCPMGWAETGNSGVVDFEEDLGEIKVLDCSHYSKKGDGQFWLATVIVIK